MSEVRIKGSEVGRCQYKIFAYGKNFIQIDSPLLAERYFIAKEEREVLEVEMLEYVDGYEKILEEYGEEISSKELKTDQTKKEKDQ